MHTENDQHKPESDRDSKGLSDTLHDLKQDLLTYVERRFELFIIQVTDPVARFLSGIIQQLFGLLLFFAGFMFAWAALALFLSELLNSYIVGLVVAAAPLILSGYLLFIRKPRFLYRIMHANLVSQIFDHIHVEPESQDGQKRTEAKRTYHNPNNSVEKAQSKGSSSHTSANVASDPSDRTHSDSQKDGVQP